VTMLALGLGSLVHAPDVEPVVPVLVGQFAGTAYW